MKCTYIHTYIHTYIYTYIHTLSSRECYSIEAVQIASRFVLRELSLRDMFEGSMKTLLALFADNAPAIRAKAVKVLAFLLQVTLCMYVCMYVCMHVFMYVSCLSIACTCMYVCMCVCMYVCITVGRPPYPERYHPRRDNHSIVRQGHFCPRRSGQADWNVHNKVIL